MASKDLISFIESTDSKSHLRVEADLGDGFFRLRIDEAERRQAAQDIRSTEDVVIEMLRNSRDAHAHSIFVAFSKDGDKRLLTILDDGEGIPASMHAAIFEPRVTSKLDTAHFDAWGMHGRGMALYSIASNTDSASVCQSDKGLGASFHVVIDSHTLSEKTDQSSFPKFEQTDSGSIAIRGPKNIIRTVAEFALEHRKTVDVYIGSPAEIAATLYAYGMATSSPSLRAFASSLDTVPIVKRLACSADPLDFSECARMLGLALSERTARRIMDGTLGAVPSMMERIEREGFQRPEPLRTEKRSASKLKSSRTLQRDFRGLKIAEDDLERFSTALRAAYRELARSYYLEEDIAPVIRVDSEAIRITFAVRNDDA